jgi:hypothetical protein
MKPVVRQPNQNLVGQQGGSGACGRRSVARIRCFKRAGVSGAPMTTSPRVGDAAGEPGRGDIRTRVVLHLRADGSLDGAVRRFIAGTHTLSALPAKTVARRA